MCSEAMVLMVKIDVVVMTESHAQGACVFLLWLELLLLWLLLLWLVVLGSSWGRKDAEVGEGGVEFRYRRKQRHVVGPERRPGILCQQG